MVRGNPVAYFGAVPQHTDVRCNSAYTKIVRLNALSLDSRSIIPVPLSCVMLFFMQAALWGCLLRVAVNAVLALPKAVEQSTPCVGSPLFHSRPPMALSFALRGVLLWVAFPLLIATFVAYVFRTSIDARSLQCAALSYALNEKVSYPASSAYAESSSSYWSKQEESLAPSCIVSPAHTGDVVTAVRTLALLNKGGLLKCDFAIRGGGHTPWAGSANIDGGVTIDMRSIDDVTVNQNKTVAFVGAGAAWGDVYQKTDSLGLAVVGGRGSTIGVGGLLTGGKQP